MPTPTAYEMGQAACRKGIGAAPALDQEFLNTYVAGLPVGDSLDLLNEWIRGWHDANLATPLEYRDVD